ncbi:MAG TPA: VanW family protein [Acidimicrobiia bacterium]
MSVDLASHLSSRIPLYVIGVTIFAALAAGGYAWYDHVAASNSTVAGNVVFAGENLDGVDRETVRMAVALREAELLSNVVSIDTPNGEVSFQLEELGFEFRADIAENDILQARHRGGVLDQFASWVSTPFTPVAVTDPTTFDADRAWSVLAASPALKFSNPVEPDLEMTGDGLLVATIGSDGLVADIDDLVVRISEIQPDQDDIRIATRSIPVPPDVTDTESAQVADSVNETTRSGATILVNGISRDLTPVTLRQLIIADVSAGTLVPRFDIDRLQSTIEELYPEPVGDAVTPTFTVSGESVTVATPGSAGEICCDPTTAATLAEAILGGAEGPFNVGAKPETDPVLTAWYDGSLITSRVSTFTTPHSCCENRVQNIQRMADIVRGYYLVPGEVLSLNAYVGPRTIEKGFLPAGAIREGRLTPEIGGGVSQFATTIFNAAYFAGLDFREYQAHSLYFSRYPYGREATISSPAPDLKIENTTEYPVLIWTSYTGTSITVSMYSTKNIEANQVASRSSDRNQCTYVETDRERIYSDGRRVIDTFFALYRPEDGIDCNGDEIPE